MREHPVCRGPVAGVLDGIVVVGCLGLLAVRHGPIVAPEKRWEDGGVTVEAIRSGIDLSYVDDNIRPQDDLFGHVNGRWLAEYDIPADRATDGAFRLLFDRAEEQVRDLITETSRSGAAVGTDEQRVGDLYASFLDEEAVEPRGPQPLRDELATMDDAADATALAAAVGALQRTGMGGGVAVYVDTDSKDSTR